MAFYSLSEAEQHIMDYMWAHADQEEIHLNEIMEYMETKGYVWKQQTAYSFVIRLKNKKILSSTKRGKRRYYSVNMSRKEFIAKGVQEYLNLAYDGSLLVFLRSLEGDHGLSREDSHFCKWRATNLYRSKNQSFSCFFFLRCCTGGVCLGSSAGSSGTVLSGSSYGACSFSGE